MQTYTFKEIIKKYNLIGSGRMLVEQAIRFCQLRGIIIELESNQHTAKYKIIDDTIFNLEWQKFPLNEKYEVAKEGCVRLTETKRLVGSLNKRDGYCIVNKGQGQGHYYIHRMVMETFNPIANSHNYNVDHINGKRSDNNIKNLRWVTSRDNTAYRDENFIKLNQLYQQLIEKYGYDELANIFNDLLIN